ncbi:MAG TPA: diacylglycerol kinase family protein [Jatrophihabitans sp.]|nr:diacylglycerol kinase family protein [Jatrophihabitans sp.]
MSLIAAVINPVKFDPDELRRAISDRAGAEVRYLLTTEQDPGAGQARQAVADGAKLLLVCGGDGTVAACAGALAGTGVAMAVLPDGTGNLLARNLGIPLELPDALEVAFAGSDRQLDVLATGDLRFLVMAGLGFDAMLIRHTDERLKQRIGWLAYLAGFVRAVKRHRRVRYEIRVDDQPPLRRRAIGVLVGNVGQLEAGITLLPDAAPDDGKLDVIVLAPRTALDWPVLAGRILSKSADRKADVLSGRRVRITAARPVPFEFDGDYVDERTELDVTVLPGALLMRCPPR